MADPLMTVPLMVIPLMAIPAIPLMAIPLMTDPLMAVPVVNDPRAIFVPRFAEDGSVPSHPVTAHCLIIGFGSGLRVWVRVKG